jgi:hypothetical protein
MDAPKLYTGEQREEDHPTLLCFRLLSMSASAAKRIWILQHKDGMGGMPFYWSRNAMSAVPMLDMATMFGNEAEALAYLRHYAAHLVAQFAPVNLLVAFEEANHEKLEQPEAPA